MRVQKNFNFPRENSQKTLLVCCRRVAGVRGRLEATLWESRATRATPSRATRRRPERLEGDSHPPLRSWRRRAFFNACSRVARPRPRPPPVRLPQRNLSRRPRVARARAAQRPVIVGAHVRGREAHPERGAARRRARAPVKDQAPHQLQVSVLVYFTYVGTIILTFKHDQVHLLRPRRHPLPL